uniref:Phytocyanin domain-containing protein n=1 Tax=Nelumbo nucifera TaxID=4432 RepID=A0A822Y885_NELNU|nr:TPA_asm: hypothetical protein HUJ06_031732 [Nelumbo nucifera]
MRACCKKGVIAEPTTRRENGSVELEKGLLPTSLSLWGFAATRFRIGDSLVWKYDTQKDSILQVTKEVYTACNTSNSIAAYKDGNTKVELAWSGPFYFINGN